MLHIKVFSVITACPVHCTASYKIQVGNKVSFSFSVNRAVKKTGGLRKRVKKKRVTQSQNLLKMKGVSLTAARQSLKSQSLKQKS